MFTLTALRHRWRTLLGGLVTLCLGITVLSASLLVLFNTAPDAPPRYDNAPVLVVPNETGPDYDLNPTRGTWTLSGADTLAADIAAVDGVTDAVAERRFDIQVLDGSRVLGENVEGDPAGAGWSSSPLSGTTLTEGGGPPAGDEVVLPTSYGADLGDAVTVLTAGEEATMTVAGLTDGTDVLIADAEAEFRASGSRVIGVATAPGADIEQVTADIQETVGQSGEVLAGADRGLAQTDHDRGADTVGRQLLAAMCAIAVFVSTLVIGASFTFQVNVRRRELGLMRAVGATPRQILRMLVCEAAALGAVASLFGAVVGVALGGALSRWMIESGQLSRYWQMETIAAPVALAILIGVATAAIGALSAARRGAKVAPLEALHPEGERATAMTRVRWWSAALAVAVAVGAGTTAAVLANQATLLLATTTMVALLVACTAAAPAYLPRLVRLLPLGSSSTAELLRAETTAGARRLASVSVPVLVVTTFGVFILGMSQTLEEAVQEFSIGDIPTDNMVVAVEEAHGISDPALGQVRELAGGPVETSMATGVYVDGQWMDAVGLDAGAPAGETMRVSPEAAAEHGWSDGDTVAVTWRDGTDGEIPITVGDIPWNVELWAGAVLPHDVARSHDPAAMTSTIFVDELTHSAHTAELEPLAVEVAETDQLIDSGITQELDLSWVFAAILLSLAVGSAGLSMATTLSLSASGRRRDFGLLRVAGAHRRQVLGLVTVETGFVVAVSCVLGLLAAWPALTAFASGMRDDFNPEEVADVSVALPWPLLSVLFAGCVILGLISALLPASRVLRRPPTENLGGRE